MDRIPVATLCALALLALPAAARADVQLPTQNLFNVDVVVNTGDVVQDRLDGPLSNKAFGTQALIAAAGCDSPAGLPNDGLFPATVDRPRVQLGYTDAFDGNNAWLDPSDPPPDPSIEFDVDNLFYNGVDFFVTSAEGTSTLGVTLHYDDATTATASRTVYDWFGGDLDEVILPAGTYKLIDGLDRIKADGTDCDNQDDPAIFGYRIDADETKTLDKITVTNEGGGRMAFFGAVGDAPETRVVRSGNGSGTVTDDLGNINCGSDCREAYDYFPGDVGDVKLTATPAVNSDFAGWSGAMCLDTEPDCFVARQEDNDVEAEFVLEKRTLTAARAGTGSGRVFSSDVPIDCGTLCGAEVDYGSTVTLTAEPAAGSAFVGWEGACSGTGACTVTMDDARSVTARFGPGHELTVTRTGDGGGAVLSSPDGIACPDDCAQTFTPGTKVTLTPSPAPASQFSGWEGACTGQTFECVVTMDAAKTVNARFFTVIADDFTPRGPSLLPDVTPPSVAATVARRVRRRALRRGLPVRVTCSEACGLVVTVRRGKRIIGTAAGSGTARVGKTVRVRLSRKARRALRRVKRLTVRVVATDVVGNTAQPLSRTVRLRK